MLFEPHDISNKKRQYLYTKLPHFEWEIQIQHNPCCSLIRCRGWENALGKDIWRKVGDEWGRIEFKPWEIEDDVCIHAAYIAGYLWPPFRRYIGCKNDNENRWWIVGFMIDDWLLIDQVSESCRLSLLTNSALVYESKCGGEGEELRCLCQWVQLCTSRDMEPK